jgi:hypothetical protein
VDSRELTEWQAFYELEPWGEKRGEDLAWYQFGEVMALIANVNRDTKKRSRPYEGTDFRPKEDEDEVDEDLQRAARIERMKQVAVEIRDRFMAKREPIILTDA